MAGFVVLLAVSALFVYLSAVEPATVSMVQLPAGSHHLTTTGGGGGGGGRPQPPPPAEHVPSGPPGPPSPPPPGHPPSPARVDDGKVDLGTCVRYKAAPIRPILDPVPVLPEEDQAPGLAITLADLGGPEVDPLDAEIRKAEKGEAPLYFAHNVQAAGIPTEIGVGKPFEFTLTFPDVPINGIRDRRRNAAVFYIQATGPELVMGAVHNNRDGSYKVSMGGLRVPGIYRLEVRIQHLSYPWSRPKRSDGSEARFHFNPKEPNEPDYTVTWYDAMPLSFPREVRVVGELDASITMAGRAALPRCASLYDATRDGRWIDTTHWALAEWGRPGSEWGRFLDDVTREPLLWLPATCRLLPIFDRAAVACVMGQNMTYRATGDSHVRQTTNLFSYQVLGLTRGQSRKLGNSDRDVSGELFHAGMDIHRDFDFYQYYEPQAGQPEATTPAETADGVTAKYGRLVGRMRWRAESDVENSMLLNNLRELVTPSLRPDSWSESVPEKTRAELNAPGDLYIVDFGAWYIGDERRVILRHARDFAAWFTDEFMTRSGPKGKIAYISTPPSNDLIDPKRIQYPNGDSNIRRIALNRMVQPILVNAGIDYLDLFNLAYPRYYTDRTRCGGHWVCDPRDLAPIGMWEQVILLNMVCPGTWSECGAR